MLLGILAACGGNNDPATSPTPTPRPTQTPQQGQPAPAPTAAPPPPVTLEIIFTMLDRPPQMSVVLDEFYAQTGNTLNTTLNFTFIPNMDDYRSSINLRLSANEQIDAVFDAQWFTMLDYIAREIYIPLDEYFNNPDYPGLYASFRGDHYLNNKFVGPDGERRTYGIPFSQNNGNIENFLIIRQDWREEAGLQPLQNMDDFEKYADWILVNKPGVFPLGRNGDIPNWLWDQPGVTGQNVIKGVTVPWTEIIEVPAISFGIGQGIMPRIVFNSNFTRALAVSWPGMTVADFTSQGVPADVAAKMVHNYDSPSLSDLYKARGYIEPDIALQNQTRPLFHAGMFGAVFGGFGNLATDTAQVQSINPNARLEFFMFSEDRRNMKPGSFTTDFMAFNFMCIPATSRNVDRTMSLFSWIFESQENNDLFMHGIEGLHWEAVGDDMFRIPPSVDRTTNYVAVGGGYQFSWNPRFTRMDVDSSPEIMAYNLYMLREDTFIGRPTAGFSFNPEPVRSELAAIGQLYVDNRNSKAVAGTTPDEKYEMDTQTLARKRAVGLNLVNDEILRQLNAFLDAKQR
jgi:putative aldouronate transport system substrate-binding protein